MEESFIMKKIFILFFILLILTGCNNLSHKQYANIPEDNIQEIRTSVLAGCSPLKKAVIKELMTDLVLDLKQNYRLEYRGGNSDDFILDSNIKEINNIMECINSENVKSDLYNACVLLSYAQIHKSQQAFDNAYEIIETINAFIFAYPLTQEYFSDWLIYVNTDDLNEFYNVTETFGGEYYSDVLENAYSEIEILPDSTLRDIIEKKERDIENNIEIIKNGVNSDEVFLLIQDLNSKMKSLKFTVDNYNPDNDYCKNVKEALYDIDAVNDRLIGILNNKELIDKYSSINSFIIGFDDKYGNNFTSMDIDTEITELCRMTARLEYLYCNSPINYIHECTSYLNATEELEDLK